MKYLTGANIKYSKPYAKRMLYNSFSLLFPITEALKLGQKLRTYKMYLFTYKTSLYLYKYI